MGRRGLDFIDNDAPANLGMVRHVANGLQLSRCGERIKLLRRVVCCGLAFATTAAWGAAPAAAEADALDFAGEEHAATSDFITTVWKSGEGLPANEILDLRETPDGYLWLGTQQGLVRFDGVRFQSFFTTPTGSRYSTRIEPLEVDGHGRLWFAPDQVGLMYYANGVFREVLTNEPTLQPRVECLRADGTNAMLWINANGGTGRIPLDQPDQSRSLKGGGVTGASKWVRDFDDNLWLVNPRNLKINRGDAWQDVPVSGTATLVAAPRRAGGVWIAREARLRYATTNGESQAVVEFPWKGQSRVQCMWEDRRNRLWIGTVGQGLFCYVNEQFVQVLPIASSITCLFEDSQDNLWAGTRGGGLVRVRERRFFVQDLNRGLRNEFVRSLAQDQAGRIWLLAAEGSLGWWQSNTWHQLGETNGWPGAEALSVAPARDGSVWISTLRRGLWHWVDGRFSRQPLGPKPPREPAVDLLSDQRGRLWMVTDNSGIYCLEGNALKNYSADPGLASGWMRCLTEDEAGTIWAGDWEGGISRFRDGHWELVRKPSGHSDAVRALVVAEGVVWIGTSASGLLRFKDGKTDRVAVEQGLPDASIRQLLMDGRGSLWAGTPHRLFRLSLEQLNAVMDGRESRVEPVVYGRSDGLPDISFASWSDPRCWRAADGELWFATANGAVHFQPADLPVSKSPVVILEKTLLNGQPATAGQLHELRPSAHRVEFHFTAPCLTAPERVRFRYQLTGVDTDWVEAGPARSVAYSALPAGHHEFQVMASSPDGIWDRRVATAIIAIHPYFWQTNWFLAAIAAALAGGGVWIVRRATVRKLSRRLELLRRQHAMDRERARIAQDIHDELGASLTTIGLLADMGARHKQDPQAVSQDLRQISETARESVAAMDAIVWALNPRNDSLDHFANYVAQFTREFFRPTSMRTRLDLPADLPPYPLAAETRHQLFLLVKESFNNVVRHAQASEVQLQLACTHDELQLRIADNGRGLPGAGPASGRNGLVNLRERIERLGGTLRIESQPGAGVRLNFVLPLPKLAAN